MAKTWDEVRKGFNFNNEEEEAMALEKEIIKTMVSIREKTGMTQTELAKRCKVKQPVIARIETSVHSPQLNSLLKILVPLGYTLQVVPINFNKE